MSMYDRLPEATHGCRGPGVAFKHAAGEVCPSRIADLLTEQRGPTRQGLN